MPSMKFKHDLPLEEAAEKISEIALGLSTGSLALGSGGSSTRFHPGKRVKLEVKASEGGKDGKVTIELSWKADLRIS